MLDWTTLPRLQGRRGISVLHEHLINERDSRAATCAIRAIPCPVWKQTPNKWPSIGCSARHLVRSTLMIGNILPSSCCVVPSLTDCSKSLPVVLFPKRRKMSSKSPGVCFLLVYHLSFIRPWKFTCRVMMHTHALASKFKTRE